jgi:glycosyltransferase involved in cell wall biosynthesis
MRLLIIHGPDELARELQRTAELTSNFKLLVAGRINPLRDNVGDAIFQFLPCRCKFDLPTIRHLRSTILRFSPDVVHAFEPRSLAQTVLATMGMRRKPKIVSFYGITRPPSWRDPSNWFTYLSRNVALHACESNAVKAALQEAGIRENLCQVIYNCVSVPDRTLSREEIRRKLNVPLDAFVVGTVATIRPVKGIDILLRAIMECYGIPNVYAVMVGNLEDPEVERLRKDERIRERVRWLGYVENGSSFMSAMDLFVMPSRKEGLCRALLEAMWQGVCPVVSDAGGMKEIVRDRIDGVVFPSEDHHVLASVIQDLQQSPDLVATYGKSAHDRVNAMCSPVVVRERVMRLYEMALSAQPTFQFD